MGYVLGVGAANVDISGRPKNNFILHDSNPGYMASSCGGVTRNVCDNLCRLGAEVKLISAVGDDVYAEMIQRECQGLGMDISHLYLTEHHASSTYINLLDQHGDMYVALSDMRVLKEMPASYLEENADLIRNADIVTCDPSLSEECIEKLLDLAQGYTPVYVDPVSTSYAKVLAPYVGRFHTVKPNQMELEILSGKTITSKEDLHDACEILLQKGVKRVICSLGEEGCLYMDCDGNVIQRKLKPLSDMSNATGAGDAFMAAIIYSTLQGKTTEDTVSYALAAGIAAIQSVKTINPDMSVALLDEIIKERTI